MESFCVWMVFLLCSPNPLISLWKCKISINKLSIYLLWISYESTDSCRNHSLSTHLGARTSTMSCLMWNTNWPNLSSDKQGNQKCFNLKSRAFCRVSKFSTALANSMYGCTGIFKNTMSDWVITHCHLRTIVQLSFCCAFFHPFERLVMAMVSPLLPNIHVVNSFYKLAARFASHRCGPSSIPGRMCEKVHQLLAVGRWFPPGTPVSSTRKLLSSSFHRLDMTLAVAEALNPNKTKQTCFFNTKNYCIDPYLGEIFINS